MHEQNEEKKPENSRMPDIGGRFKFLEDSKMKTKNRFLAGAVAGLSFLALAATSSYAYQYGTTCNDGTITKVGSVYLGTGTPDNAPAAGMYRLLEITCNDSGWTLGTNFVLYPSLDNDGMFATALTAMADDKKVEFVVYPYGKLKALLGVLVKATL
ncbi:hypothetical protein [Candidatus Electronema sp. TJ]|uniref:hypothetical protein n=1 Tax=Candidatus Electronema sp. TJ TaxID=3401573 RepID=UPI003AA8FB70